MKRIELIKPWNDRPIVQVVTVDDRRAEKLIESGLGQDADKPRKPKTRSK